MNEKLIILILGFIVALGCQSNAQVQVQQIQQEQEQRQGQIEKWRQDLNFLDKHARKTHYNLFHTISEQEWAQAVGEIHDEIPQMTELQFFGAMMKLLAKVNDGHTVLYPPFQGSNAFSALPIEFYFFEDELYVRAADQAYQELVGKKIKAICGIPAEKVVDRVAPYIARDNKYQIQWIMPIALQFVEIYELIGLIKAQDLVRITVMDEQQKEITRAIAAGSLQWNPMGRFAPSHWVHMHDAQSNLWTKDPENFYWYEYLQESQLVYFQFNQIRDKEDQTIADFVNHDLIPFINGNPVKGLIIDLRLNNGGNNFLNQSLVHALIRNDKINQPGKLFVITGRRTFSAAMNLASDLELHTHAIFVGEPTGSKPNFYGEENPFQLPNSGFVGSISSRYWQGGRISDDNRKWIEPKIKALLSAQEFKDNKDPCLEAINDYLMKP